MNNKLKLVNYLNAQSSLARRKAAQAIRDGKVTVNGKVVESHTMLIDPKKDRVILDGLEIKYSAKKLYFKFYKPVNVVCTVSDPQDRRCLKEFLAELPPTVFPVGRLDRQSSGLLFFTNDGDWAAQILHPSAETNKTYNVTLDKNLTKNHFQRLLSGIMLSDGPFVFTEITPISKSQFSVKLHEGRNRIIRRAFALLSYEVIHLKRTAIGQVTIDGLLPGRFKELSEKDARLALKAAPK